MFKWISEKVDENEWWRFLFITIAMLILMLILATFFDGYDWFIGKIFKLIGL